MSKKRIGICIEKSPFDDDVLECCVNGRINLIKRGERVEVAKDIYDLLLKCGLIDGEVKE